VGESLVQILYHPHVKSEDIPRLDHAIARRIEKIIKNRLSRDPELFGLPLRRGLSGYRKMRMGDYRIIYKVVAKQIRILAIGHRSDIYSIAPERTDLF
jgi:mRNA interferase RelE/StbE